MNSSTTASFRAPSHTDGDEGARVSRQDARHTSPNTCDHTLVPTNRLGSFIFWIACAALPIVMLCAISAWGGVYPFGPESFLTEDLKYQYIDFFTWFRRVLTGEANIFYSFAQGMGSNTWGLYSYYLASPFNLIILLFDEAHLTLAIYVIVALKLACMNTTMAWYLRRRFSLQRSWALALALCYTWSTWTATNLRNPLWLDALILLPLMAWSCYQLLHKGTFLSLSLLVAADVIVCWYMAYITLLFCCLFVLFELATMAFDEGEKPSGTWIAGRAGRFTAAVLLGLGLSAWTFVPTILAMMGGGATKAFSHFHTYPSALIRGFLPGAWNLDHVPQFYTGLIPLILALAMLLEKRIDKRLRGLTLLFAGFLVVSSVLGVLMVVWCGFRQPTGFYCRIAFLLSFLEIWAAAYLLMRRTELRPVNLGKHCALWHESDRPRKRLNPTVRRLAPFGAIAFVVMDLGLNAHVCWNQLYINYPQETHDAYVSAVDTQMQQLEKLDAEAFYRVDKTYNRSGAAFNEGIAHGFNQLSTYSSANNPKAVALLNTLGYSSEGEFSSVYTAPNLVMDSILGVRYIGTWTEPAGTAPTDISSSPIVSPLFYSLYALSLGLPCDAQDISSQMPEGDNPFERQNSLFAQVTGIDDPLYTELEGTVEKNDGQQISWRVQLPADSIGYAYVQTGVESDWSEYVSMIIDDEFIPMEGTRFSHNVRSFGGPSAQSTSHTISVIPGAEMTELPSKTTCAIYALNMDVFERGVEQLRSGQFSPTTFEDGHVSGTYRAGEATGLLLSIPYDKGWNVTVDGTAVELSPAYDGGMSLIEVPAGEHEIEMTYRSPGLGVGIIVSGVAAASIAALTLIRRKRN